MQEHPEGNKDMEAKLERHILGSESKINVQVDTEVYLGVLILTSVF